MAEQLTLADLRREHLTPSGKRRVVLIGYAGTPGAGPEGERCGSCVHATAHEMANRWYKCAISPRQTGSRTDIRLRSPACERWEKKP